MRALIIAIVVFFVFLSCTSSGQTVDVNVGSEALLLKIESELENKGVWFSKKSSAVLIIREVDEDLVSEIVERIIFKKHTPSATFVALSKNQLVCMRRILDGFHATYIESVIDGKVWVTVNSDLPESYPFSDCER